MLKNALASLLIFACTAGAFAEPADKASPELIQALATYGQVVRLTALLPEHRSMAQEVADRLRRERPKNYLKDVDRVVALNTLARLLADSGLEKELRSRGEWFEDPRWGGARQAEAVVDLARRARFFREKDCVDRLTRQGAYRAAYEHCKHATNSLPFEDRSRWAVEMTSRRAALDDLLDTQGVGEANVFILSELQKSDSEVTAEVPATADSWMASILDLIRAAERAGLPLSAREAYLRLDKTAERIGLPVCASIRFIVQSQLFHLEWEGNPLLAGQARQEFERISKFLDSAKEMNPFWAARVSQALVSWREIAGGEWYDAALARWEKKFSQPQFRFAQWRSRVQAAAAARREGKTSEAARLLAQVEPLLFQEPYELSEWKEVLGKTPISEEVALLRQEYCVEKARQFRTKGNEADELQALLSYRAALQLAFRPRDIVDILNEEAPLVRKFEPHNFESENRRAASEADRLYHRLGLLNAHAELGLYQADQGRASDAVKNLAKAIELFEKYLVDLRPSEQQREALRSRLRVVYERYAELKLQQGDAQGAFQALAQNAQVQQSWSAPRLRSQDARLQARLDTAQLQKEKALVQQVAKVPNAALLAQNKSEFFSVVRELRSSGKNYGGLLAVQPVEFAQLQQSLPEDTLLVQYYPSPTTLYFFVVSRQGFKVRSLALPKEQLSQRIQAFRTLCKGQAAQAHAGSWDWSGPAGKQLSEQLNGLHRVLIEPLAEDLAGHKVLAVVPTEHLLYLPFPALASLSPDSPKPHFLVEDYAVVTLLRATDIARVGKAQGSKGSLLALGNPDGSLEGAQKEVEELARTFPQADVVVRQQATATRLLKPSKPARLIHLATHAVLDQKQPNSSYLVVAGKGDEGRLTVPQIFDLPLQDTRLVTLSACETTLGEREPGAAVSSLAEAFWVAGSPSLIASLWAVEDNSTGRLMVDFYRNLQEGKPMGEALRQAQVGLIREPRTSHPFFWAPFVLIGDWQ